MKKFLITGLERLKKPTAIALAFLFVLTPLRPVLAEEAPAVAPPAAAVVLDTPATDTVSQTPTIGEVVDDSIGQGSLGNDASSISAEQVTPKSSTETNNDKDKSNKDPKNNDPSVQSAAEIPGESNADPQNTSSIKQKLPNVGEFSGALEFNYPIKVPSGRNGLNPEVSLQYDSQNANEGTLLGYGWTVSIPFIERVNKTGISKIYTDNYFSSSLEGELVDLGGGIYGSKVENGEFIKYVFSTNVWTVTDKQGTIYKFGSTNASRQDNAGDSTQVFKWMLEEVRDTNDNYVKYSYIKDAGQIYPYQIKYTGHGTVDGSLQLEFINESRSDAGISYKTGFAVHTNYRIREIQVVIDSNWVNKYSFGYTTGDNNNRSILQSVTQSGRDEASVTTVMPQMSFVNQTNSTGLHAFSASLPPESYPQFNEFADINGDGLTDLFLAYDSFGPDIQKTYLNDGNGGWVLAPGYASPRWYSTNSSSLQYFYHRIADVNGDGLNDLVGGIDYGINQVAFETYLNTGTGWQLSSTWQYPFTTNGSLTSIKGPEILDVNGDGLADLVRENRKVHLNNGSGWDAAQVVWNWPQDPVTQSENELKIVDLNNDGISDLLFSRTHEDIIRDPYGNVSYPYNIERGAWLGRGDGSFIESSNYAPPVAFSFYSSVAIVTSPDLGVRVYDYNGDGLQDLVQMTKNTVIGRVGDIQTQPLEVVTLFRVYLNTGNGWLPAKTIDCYGPCPHFSYSGQHTLGSGFITDFDGNKKLDFHDSNNQKIYRLGETQAPVDLINNINYPSKSSASVVYQATAKYKSGTGSLLNPNLPSNLDTVKSISLDDGNGLVSTKTYSYEGGKYYYGGSFDRKFAGFSKITRTDSVGNTTTSFNHQGDSTNTGLGEYNDEMWKIGKTYRVETADSSGNIYTTSINKWDSFDLGSGRKFIKLSETLSQEFDGNASHKDKAVGFTYDNTNGNLVSKIEYGEVLGSSNGTFTDTGSDKQTSSYTYASSGSGQFALSGETVLSQVGSKIRESKFYYDNLPFGQVSLGNETKQELWKQGSSYVNTQKTYNSFGLVTDETDARGKNTHYVYDSYNLYPSTITNAKNQSTQFLYDYTLGKPKQVIDSNNLVFQTIYDGLGRVVEEKQPDQTTPSTLVTKTTFIYTPLAVGWQIHKTDFLDATNSVDSYTYLDGFDRPVQVRLEHEDAGQYVVVDTVYNNIEQVAKESLPYISSGSGQTSATTVSSLLSTNTYDALYRVTSVTNAVGSTSSSFDDWKTTVLDPRGKTKDLYKDAYGNLVRVDEHNASSTYTTNYEYDGNNQLTKITDASGNVRNFTYDGLGRRLVAEDLHAALDTSFGSYIYTYDEGGNLLSSLDPNGQTVNYTYDDLSRPLTEDFTGSVGTEVVYTYDTCTLGVGKLCSAEVVGTTLSQYSYSPTGQVSTDLENTSSQAFTTSYTYDRQGNQLEVTSPDNSKVKYTYNTAGQLETVDRKEAVDPSWSSVVTDFDYGPHGKVTFQENANGSSTINTYDSAKLYRLMNKRTVSVNTGPTGGITTTTATFYPDSNAIDGRVRHSGGNVSWDTLVNGVGNNKQDTDWLVEMHFRTGSIPGQYQFIDRGIALFDTTSIPDNATILSATLSLFGYAKTDNLNTLPDINIYSANPNSNTALTGTDYSTIEDTPLSNTISYSVWNSNGYNNFVLNANGLANISKTSISKFGVRNVNRDTANIAPLWANDLDSGFTYYTSRETGILKDPKLVITYETPGVSSIVQDVSYTYDANGNVTQLIDASYTSTAKTVNYTYDDLNRLLTSTASAVASGQETYTYAYTYDALGNILTRSETVGVNPITVYTYSYSGNQGASFANPHAVTRISDGTNTVNYTYDNNGNLLSDGTQTHTWDYKNRLVSTAGTTGGGGTISATVNFYPYAGDGSVYKNNSSNWNTTRTATSGNGVTSGTTAKVVAGKSGSKYHIERAFLPFDTSSIPAGATIDSAKLKVYVNSKTNTDNDGTDWVTVVKGLEPNTSSLTTADYDLAGTVNSPTEGIDAGERKDITSISTGAYIEFNLNSTGLSWITPGGESKFALREGHDVTNSTYSGSNSTSNSITFQTGESGVSVPVLEVTYTAAGNPSQTVVSYAYDHTGQRVKLDNGTTATLYPTKYYNTHSTGSGSETKHIFTPSGDMVATVETESGATTVYYQHTDHLSGQGVTTDQSGITVETVDYYPYGGLRIDEKTGSFSEQRKFTGSEYDVDTGLNYMQSRYYKNDIGRFISQDPAFLLIGDKEFQDRYQRTLEMHLANPQALNSYSYVNNNPLTYIDETGEIAPLVVLGLVWAAAELGLSGYDAYSTYKTLTNPNAPPSEKIGSLGLFGLGLVGPGGGYKTLGNKADDGLKALRGLDKTNDLTKVSQKYNWANPNTLQDHFIRHGDSVKAKDPSDYARKASDFFKNSQRSGVETLYDAKEQTIRIYDRSTNTFGAYKPDGSTRSFYKPDNSSYWDRNKGNWGAPIKTIGK